MAFKLHDFEQVQITVEALDVEGNPADVDISFFSSDPSVVEVQDNGDGSALLVASPGEGGLGTATITAVQTNEDGSTLEGALEVEVVAGDAVTINIIPGNIEAKPPQG